jgi:hypothetical protein
MSSGFTNSALLSCDFLPAGRKVVFCLIIRKPVASNQDRQDKMFYDHLFVTLFLKSHIMRTVRSSCISVSLGLMMLLSGGRISAQSEDIAPGMATGLPVLGYVVLMNGDTLYGRLRWTLKYVENNPVEIKFIPEKGESKLFNAGEIKGFGNRNIMWMENNPIPVKLQFEHYVSMPSFKKGVPVFYNRLLDGRITVFQNRSAVILSSSTVVEDSRIDGIAFSFSPGEGLSIGLSYRTDYRIINSRPRLSSYYVSKDNAPYIKVEKNNYEALFKTLFGDCPAIDQEINKNPDLKLFKNFMLMAEVYNRVCQGNGEVK